MQNDEAEVLVEIMLVKNNKLLVEIRKKSDDFHPGAAWIPGGHMEENETPEEAIFRESEEEFGIKLVICKEVCTSFWRDNHKNKDYKIHYFASEDWDGEIKNKEAAELIWIGREEIEKLDEEVDRTAFVKYLNSK